MRIFHPAVIKAVLPVTIILAAANSFRYVDKLFYLVPLFYLYLIAAAFFTVEDRRKFYKDLLLFVPFGIWASLTSLWSLYPVVSLTRAAFFLLMSAAALSLALLSIRNYESIFKVVLPLNIIIILSALLSLITGYPEDAWSGGNGIGFMGFAGHQNTLGALILYTIPAPVYYSIKNYKLQIKNYSWIAFALLVIFNFSFLIASHSRASLLALAIMLLIMGWFLLDKKKFISIISLVLLLIAAAWFFPITHTQEEIPRTSFHAFIFKGENTLGDNRWFMYEDSFKAAFAGGVIGLGYGISHPEITNNANGSRFENGRYIREKGNSVLALVEETGIIGLVLFVVPLVVMIKNGRMTPVKYPSDFTGQVEWVNGRMIVERVLIFASLTSFFVHAQFEGWWAGTASPLLFLFFLFIGGGFADISAEKRDF